MTKVLLLADDRDAQLLDDFLPRDRYTLEWEGSYDASKTAFERDEHDVYLIDVLFGGGRGATLAQAAARRGSHPVIVVTRRLDPVFESKVLARGVADVLVRADLSPSDLERALRHAVARAARERRSDRSDLAASTVGLPGLEFRLQNAVARARRGLGGAAVLAVQCDPQSDGDTRVDPGMMALLQGDALDRFRSCLRDVDTISRAQNTLFALIEDADPRYLAAHAADRILSEMGIPFQIRGKALRVVPSVGVSVYPTDGDDPESLIDRAREAMASAVRAGGNGFQFPKSSETGAAARRIALERRLDQAVEEESFTIVYQPQVDILEGKVVGAEALLRWNDPELGVVPPSEFIPVLESANLIEVVGEWVLRKACAQAKKWADESLPLKMSVNVSARQFVLGDVVGVARAALDETGLPAKDLCLELTEGVMLDSTPEVRGSLETLRAMGVRIAIDDFGTGYASLRYVKHFPMDIVKIDKEFVRGLPLNSENAAITNSIVSLAHSLGLYVVAEGVESEAEAEFLRDLRCQVVQGFLHARPMTPEDFEQWRAGFLAKAG